MPEPKAKKVRHGEKPGPKPEVVGTDTAWQEVMRKAVNTPRPNDWPKKKK